MESPSGVGFSYSTNKEVDYKIDDEQTAADNYGVLVNFFRAYPEYKKNDFYITWDVVTVIIVYRQHYLFSWYMVTGILQREPLSNIPHPYS